MIARFLLLFPLVSGTAGTWQHTTTQQLEDWDLPTTDNAAPTRQLRRQPKVEVCKVPPGNPAAFHTITVGAPAVNTHVNKGSFRGACNTVCEQVCDDGDPCTDDSECDDRICYFPPVDCDDGNLCTTNSCDPVEGCVSEPVECDDGNRCTRDECDPDIGCTFTAIDCDEEDDISDEPDVFEKPSVFEKPAVFEEPEGLNEP